MKTIEATLMSEPAELATCCLSGRLKTLIQRYHTKHAEARARHGNSSLFYDDDERQTHAQAIIQAYEETVGQPAIVRRARALELFADSALVHLDPEDIFAGSQRFCGLGFPKEINETFQQLGYANNAGHIIHDYAGLVQVGIDGLAARIAARQSLALTADEAAMLEACGEALTAFSRFITRHCEEAAEVAVRQTGTQAAEWRAWADELEALAHDRPTSFRGALQLVWFAQIFLHAENPTAAISFGRLDQYLWPHLRDDMEAGLLDRSDAGNLVAAFFLRCCEGEESQNLTIGGVDDNGVDATNPLSFLLLEVMAELRVCQPSLSVRLHPGSPDELVQAACALATTGTGQPAFINDAAVIPGLQRLNIPLERARDFGIVGCYEPATCGDCYPNTVCGTPPDLVESLVVYLQSPEALAAPDFSTFLEGWFTRIATGYQSAVATKFQSSWDTWREKAPSPFGSVLMGGCVENARALESGGARFNLFGVTIVGLGTAVDSLHVINNLVFQRRELALSELSAAMAADFPDETLRRRLQAIPGRYGTDSEATNKLAAQLSERIATMVLESRMDHGVRPYPAFFKFTADIWSHPYATPDGRHIADPLSYGCGPASTCGGTPTSILASASSVAHHLCPCGNPLALSLLAQDFTGPEGTGRLAALVLGYFACGGFHLHVNLLHADELRAAQEDPSNHGELMIRISGLSTKFVTLRPTLQDALIQRAEHGV